MSMKDKVEELEKRIKELEARPPIQYHYHTHPVSYPVYPYYPAPNWYPWYIQQGPTYITPQYGNAGMGGNTYSLTAQVS